MEWIVKGKPSLLGLVSGVVAGLVAVTPACGFAGIMVGTLPHGEHGGNLDDPALDPFWEAVSRLGVAVVMHPMFVCGEPRLAGDAQ